MRTEEIKVYTFEELDKKAKEKAREWYKSEMYKDFSVEAEMITENMENVLYTKGYSGAKVYWELSCRQGDGVCFTWEKFGRDKDILTIFNRIYNNNIPKNILRVLPFVKIEFTRTNSSYCHKNTVRVDYSSTTRSYIDNCPRVEKVIDELIETLDDDRKNLCNILETQGYDEIDYYYSDEYIDETIICNEYEFYADGTKY